MRQLSAEGRLARKEVEEKRRMKGVGQQTRQLKKMKALPLIRCHLFCICFLKPMVNVAICFRVKHFIQYVLPSSLTTTYQENVQTEIAIVSLWDLGNLCMEEAMCALGSESQCWRQRNTLTHVRQLGRGRRFCLTVPAKWSGSPMHLSSQSH